MNSELSISPDNIVVYTAIFNDYDVLLRPRKVSYDVDYICFTDNPDIVPDPWQAKKVVPDFESMKRESARYKFLPHKHFPKHDLSIWVDGNIHVLEQPERIISDLLGDSNLAVSPHPERNCIYDEAEALIRLGKSNPEPTREQINKYRQAGLPQNFGLSSTGVLIRRHHHTEVITVMEKWWDEFMSETSRDQLSFEYVAWENTFNYSHVNLDFDEDGDYFFRVNHKPSGIWGVLWEKLVRQRETLSGTPLFLSHVGASSIYYMYRINCILRQDGASELLRSVGNTVRRWIDD